MTRNGKKKSHSVASTSGRGKEEIKRPTGAVELKDVEFEMVVDNPEKASSASDKLENILSKLDGGCGISVKNASAEVEDVGHLKKKMAALGFDSGIHLSNGGAFRDARKILEGFPGDDEYELTFEEVCPTSSTEEDETTESCSSTSGENMDELAQFKKEFKYMNERIMAHLMYEGEGDAMARLNDQDLDDEDEDEDYLCSPSEEDGDDLILDGSSDLLLGLDPLKALSATRKGKYPLIDPLKLQVIQSAESELTSVHDLFESTKLSPGQKLPLLKRKYMELMQQDIRHRLEALRVRDYLDTLHLERQVVERELEKAMNLRKSLEQLCEQLQTENSRIRAEKAGISAKIYGDLELKALLLVSDEEEENSEMKRSGSNGNNKNKNKSGGNNSSKKHSNNNSSSNNNSTTTSSSSNSSKKNKNSSSSSNSNSSSTNYRFPSSGSLPDGLKSVSYEIPDANRLLEGAQGALRDRFQLLIDLYNQREVHFLAVLKAKDVEIQLLQGHYYTHLCQLQRRDEANRALSGHVAALGASESDLRSQLSVYVDKFKQVEDTLTKSNDLFATFRHEMEQMTQKLSRLERENQSFQTKCTTLSRNIIEMADERSKQALLIEQLKGQKSKLESVCRSMQAERNAALCSKPQ
jgi:hypothetical protein